MDGLTWHLTLGPLDLKNISRPVEAFVLRTGPTLTPTPVE